MPLLLPSVDSGYLYGFFDRGLKPRFSALESAIWNEYMGSIERRAADDYSFGINGGFTLRNTTVSNAGTADGGLSFSWRGFSTSAGISVPVLGQNGANITPAFVFSLGWTPVSTRIGAIEAKRRLLDAQMDVLTLEEAEQQYTESMATLRQTVDDLLSQRNENDEQIGIYESLSADMTEWYSRGVITEREYRKAMANLETMRLQKLSTEADLLITELILSLLFYRRK